MNTKILLSFILFSVGCGTPSWTVRTAEPCASSLGDPRTDQERAYLATLLALDDRRYEVAHRESPRYIEATAQHLRYDLRTTWVIHITRGGAMRIDQPENDRETHKSTARWFGQLTRSIELYRCRDIDWLRWNAENRGLVPVGDAVPSAGGEAMPSAGGEVSPDDAAPEVDLAPEDASEPVDSATNGGA